MRYPARFFAVVLILTCIFTPIATVNADNLQITATVPAQAIDYTATLSSPTGNGTVGPGENIDYTITYGTSLSYNTPVTIVASWSQATPQGASYPAVDLLSYVSGSATKALNQISPVIDPVNRTISWTISPLPANTTDQTVSFKLNVSNTYITPQTLNFTVSAYLQGPGVTTPTSSLAQSFRIPPPSTNPTPTPLPGTPSPTATPTPLPTSAPTPTTSGLTFQTIDIRTIDADTATVFVKTSLPSTLSLAFGDSLDNLSQQVTDQTSSTSHLLSLTGLTPNTQYYFRMSATAANGRSITSDIYTFFTAQAQSNPPVIVPGSLTATSGNTTIDTPVGEASKSALPYLLLPGGAHFTIRIGIGNTSSLTSIQSFISNAATSTDPLELVPLTQGQFRGTLQAPFQIGNYDLIVRLTGADGSITETKVAKVLVVDPLRVVDSRTGAPLPDSKVTVYFQDPKTGRFELITPSLLTIRNPLFAAQDGSVDLVLPVGTYQVKVSDLSYQDQTVTFTLGPRSGYPTVRLVKQGFSLANIITYLKDSIVYLVTGLTGTYLMILTGSTRALFLTALLSLVSLIILTLLSFASRTKVSLFLLPSLIVYHFAVLFQRRVQAVQCLGIVVGENGEPLFDVSVFATSQESQQVVAHAITARNGHFTLLLPDTGEYWINVMKAGYHPFSELENFSSANPEVLSIALVRHDAPQTVKVKTKAAITAVLDFSFELVLLFSVTLELLIGMSLGWKIVIGFLLLSLFNLFTWIIYLHNQRKMSI